MNIDTINELIDQNIYENTKGAITASSLKAVLKAITGAIIPLIQLSDETVTHILQRDGGECVELDGLRTPALYRVAAKTPLGTTVSTMIVSIVPGGKITQAIYNCDLSIKRAMIDGVWQRWEKPLYYIQEDQQ